MSSSVSSPRLVRIPSGGEVPGSEGDDLVFLSPEEDFDDNNTAADTGASPALTLRGSNRKRKSVFSETMTKGSGSKKKKASPGRQDDPGKSMPRIPRTPQGDRQQQQQQPKPPQDEQDHASAVPEQVDSALERALLGMEQRLASRMEANTKAVNALSKMTNESMEALEEKVDNNEEAFKAAIEKSEVRMLDCIQSTVKDMVLDQLRAAGFDPDLTAANLRMVTSSKIVTETPTQRSYADITADAPAAGAVNNGLTTSLRPSIQAERREAKFWECKTSLRLWPIAEPIRESLISFLKDKLRLDNDFVTGELGKVEIKINKDPRAKNKEEAVVVFETKEIRNAVKAQAANLANFRNSAGMRLQIPNHLQKDFKTLMALSHDLKKKNLDLKRNVKFDEDDHGLFMDFQLRTDGRWNRVKPVQAKQALDAAGGRRNGPEEMEAGDLVDLLHEGASGEDQE